MDENVQPANAMTELRKETREFLSKLEPSDLDLLQDSIALMRRLADFGVVMKWIAIVAVAIVAGIVTFGESISKIATWFKS